MRQMPLSLALLGSLICILAVALPAARADDLKGLDVPVFRDRAGYGLGLTEYSLETKAELLEGESPEHTLELAGLLQPPDREDVLCFSTSLLAQSAENARGKDVLQPSRRRNREQVFKALLPSQEYRDRRGTPLLLCEVSLNSISLDQPGYEVEELVVLATAVIVEEREEEEIDADVADGYIDIGHGTQVQVSSKEIDRDGEMTVKLNIKRSGDKRSPVFDSLFALNSKGKSIGGGRWTNELDLFAKNYEVELAFPLTGDEDSVDRLRVVLATEYEIEEIEFTIEGVFQE